MSDAEPEITVAVENIPEELQDRDQWLLWDARADRPKQPHWNGNHAISWSSPEDWATFDDAVEAVESRDSWGLGYVTAVENDDYARGLYAVIDLDGAFDEDGHARDWVPDLSPFFDRDAYVEISPSGTGLHIPVVGMEVPEWWADVEVSADAHQGVDLLANKFCTFTGDLARGSGTEVVEYGEWIDEWLADAYEEIKGEAPPTRQSTTLADASGGEGGSGDTDDWDRETVEEMLDTLPNNQHYNDWRDTLFAIHNWDSGTTGKALAEKWSRSNSKWEEPESQRVIDDIWENRDADGPVTLGTLVHKAEQAGWEPSGPADWKATVAKHSDQYDDPSEVPDDLLAENETETEATKTENTDETETEATKTENTDETETEATETENTDETETDTIESENGAETETGSDNDETDLWDNTRSLYAAASEQNSGVPKGAARSAAADALEEEGNWLYVLESERLWKYDSDTGTYSEYGKEALRRMLESADRLGQFFSRSERREIQARIEARNGIHRSELDARGRDQKLICVGNGVIDLETGELHDHSPEYHMTRGLAWDYDPDADPRPVRDFLDDVTERVEDRDTLLDHLAHGLLPGHPQRAFVVTYGPGSNGKTRVARLFSGFVGDENAAAVEIDDLVNDDFASSDLVGAYLNWGDDMSGDRGGALTDVSTLKKASGGSELRANEKYEKTFKFQNQASLFFSANEPPRFGEQTPALADRLYPIRMPYRFVNDPDPDDPMQKEREPRVAQKLLDDDDAMRGLLSLVVEHARDVLETGEYSQPEGPEERMQKYRGEADPIVRFCRTALKPADGDSLVKKDDAYTVYQKYAEAWDERIAGEDGFKRQLTRAAPFDLDTARSRSLAGDDDPDRVRCWKYVTWSADAREVMPDWIAEQYDFDTEEDDSDTATVDTLAPADVTAEAVDGSGRVPTVEANVTAAWSESAYGDEQQKLTLSDGDGNRTAEIVGRDRPELREGARVMVTGARASRGEFGGITLEIDPQTDVAVVSAPTDASEKTAAASTDGGTETTTETDEQQTTPADGDTDPDPPSGPFDDAQCRECGTYWSADADDPREECSECGAPVDWDWNVETGRVAAEYAPTESDHDGVVAEVKEYLRVEEPDTVTAAEIAGGTGVEPTAATDALDRLAEETTIVAETEGGYDVLR